MNTVEEIKKAISEYFGDTSRSQDETRQGLEDIASHAEMFLDALPE